MKKGQLISAQSHSHNAKLSQCRGRSVLERDNGTLGLTIRSINQEEAGIPHPKMPLTQQLFLTLHRLSEWYLLQEQEDSTNSSSSLAYWNYYWG